MSNARDESSIRAATTEDVDELAVIHSRAWQAAYKDILPDDQLRSFTPGSRRASFTRVVVAKPPSVYLRIHEGQPVAFVAFGQYRECDLDVGQTGEIRALYVLPKYWRRGFGRELCKFAEVRLAEGGYVMVAAWVLEQNVNAKGFYLALGYREDGATKRLEIGASVVADRMLKSLVGASAAGAVI